MDCFASLAMTVDTVSPSRDALRPRFAEIPFPPTRGRQDHTVLPYAASFTKPFDRPVRPAEVLAEAFKRRSSTRCRSLTENRPANMLARPTLPRPPHPIPTFRDDRDTPLVEGMRCGS